ncbi:MAG: hypothetical protein Q9160_004352 [Pyrenula sp. 1 TL-2023]
MTSTGIRGRHARSSDSTGSKADVFDHGHSPLRGLQLPSSPRIISAPDPHLLSPPISEKDFDIPPYKPTDSDRTSLSMISSKSHKGKGKRPPAKGHVWSSDSLLRGAGPEHGPSRSCSLPDLKHIPDIEGGPAFSTDHLDTYRSDRSSSDSKGSGLSQLSCPQRQHALGAESKRWTLPSKTHITPAVSQPNAPSAAKVNNISIIVESSRDSTHPKGEKGEIQAADQPQAAGLTRRTSTFSPDTPAMITLRRATAGRQTRVGSSDSASTVKVQQVRRGRRASLEPTGRLFEQLLTLCVAKFSNLSIRLKDSTETSLTASPDSVSLDHTPSRSRRISLLSKSDNKDPGAISSAAEPVITHVEISRTFPVQSEGLDSTVRRRTSTKVLSGLNVHEIIWEDDHDSRGNSRTPSSRRSSRSPSRSLKSLYSRAHRQGSSAVEALDATLKKADNGSRRPTTTLAKQSKSRRPSESKKIPSKPKRRTIQSVFGKDWYSDNRPNFQGYSSETQGLLRQHNQGGQNGHTAIASNSKSDPSQTQVFFFPPLPNRAESGLWKSPIADINSRMSGRSSLSDEGELLQLMSSGSSVAHRPSCPPNSTYAAQNYSKPWLDLHDCDESKENAAEGAISLNPMPSPLRAQTGTKLGSSSHSRRPSHEILQSNRSRSASIMPSEVQSPARGSVSKVFLDGSYSSDATAPRPDAREKRPAYATDDDSSPGRRLSVQEFIQRIEKLTVDGQHQGGMSDRDKSVASWAEGLPVSFTGRSLGRSRGISKSRGGDAIGKLGGLVE